MHLTNKLSQQKEAAVREPQTLLTDHLQFKSVLYLESNYCNWLGWFVLGFYCVLFFGRGS